MVSDNYCLTSGIFCSKVYQRFLLTILFVVLNTLNHYMRIFLLVITILSFSQIGKSERIANDTINNQGIKISLEMPIDISPNEDFNYKPDVYGVVKAQLFYNLDSEKFKFNVANARLGVFGNLSKFITYRVEGDFCASGNVELAAANITYSPFNHFSITMGQFKMPISLDFSLAIFDMPFIAPSFQVTKLSLGFLNRGITINYAKKEGVKLPFSFDLTMCNGLNTLSFKEWEFTPTFSTKATISPFSKFWIGAAGLIGSSKQLESNRILPCKLYNTEVSYFGNTYIIHSEFGQKFTTDTAFVKKESSFVFQGGYRFNLNKSKQLSFISPRLRFDFIIEDLLGNNGAPNVYNDIYRLTGGLAVRFRTKFMTEVKLMYDKYFYSDNREIKNDMLSFEATIKF